MDIESELRNALTRIPGLLLSPDDQIVRSDAMISLDVHKASMERATVVALVGPSGSGRSWLFNALVEASLSPEGTLRPTTSALVAAGAQTGFVPWLQVDVLPASGAPDGVVFIDTPAWEHEPDVVRLVISRADVVVVVVSPSRYADASVASLWSDVNDESLLVLNRTDLNSSMLDVLNRSVADVFGQTPIVVGDGQESLEELESQLSKYWGHTRRPMAAIGLAAAQSAAGHLARGTARMAKDVQEVIFAVGEEQPFDVAPSVFTVRDSWLSSKQALVEEVAREIRERDDRIVQRSSNSLAERLLADLGAWNDHVLDADLDAWKQRCKKLFGDEATIRWRRGPAEHVIDTYSWKIAVNSAVVAPRRFRKIMGKRLTVVAAVAHDELQVLIAGSVEERRVKWAESLDELGEYQPGILLALAGAPNVLESRDD